MHRAEQSRVSTGVEFLDQRLDGGFPEGSLVAYTAPPPTQSEHLLYEVAAQRPTHYLATLREAENVERALEDYPADVGETTVTDATPDDTLDDLEAACTGPEQTVVVDATDTLERRDRAAYRRFLDTLQGHVRRTDGMALLHCYRTDDAGPNRDVTLGVADVTLELERDTEGLTVDHRLFVTKCRGGAALTEPIDLELTDSIEVDTTRDVA